jgi:outer membrane protein assembly factor BamB
MRRFITAVLVSAWCGFGAVSVEAQVSDGWLQWRGPSQVGVAAANLVVEDWSDPARLTAWTADLRGRGAAVVARYADGDRLFVGGYRGSTSDLIEVLACLDPADGRVIWEKRFPDFMSDIIYNRYSIGAPSIDAETGNVYWLSSPGILVCFDRDGVEQWQVSMMEMFGRLTFPNGRTGSPTIHDDLVIVNAITSNWGREGPAKNRFYAFDKKDGQLVWSSDPGVGPPFLKDSSFSTPIFERREGHDVFYAGLGDGNVVCVNARTGEPIWRYQMCVGGLNGSPVVWKGNDTHPARLIITHGQENVHDTGRGFAAAVDLDKAWADWAAARKGEGFTPPFVLKDDEHILWRNDALSMFTSSPTLVGDRVYQLTESGHLFCLDVTDGKTIWSKPLGGTALHGSPLYVDGLLFVPMWQRGFFVIRAENGDVLAHWPLEGECIGSPTIFGSKLYVHTTAKLYAFSLPGVPDVEVVVPFRRLSPPHHLLIKPAEVLLRPEERVAMSVRPVDQAGHAQSATGASLQSERWVDGSRASWEHFVPPTARVKSKMLASVDSEGHLVADAISSPSAGAIQATIGGLRGEMRGRILPSPPYTENFESFELTETDKATQAKFAYPPLPWIGARLRWDVREDPTSPGNKVFAKTLDNILFMRSMAFIGHPDDRDYTVAADVMTDGNRRNMSCVGVINQRYIIAIDGNKQALEVTSNHDRVKIETPFKVEPKTWYRLETRVEVREDGSGVVYARAWKRGEDRPEDWTLTATVPYAHTQGSPGLYGFSPGSRFSVFIDNVEVKPNE